MKADEYLKNSVRNKLLVYYRASLLSYFLSSLIVALLLIFSTDSLLLLLFFLLVSELGLSVIFHKILLNLLNDIDSLS